MKRTTILVMSLLMITGSISAQRVVCGSDYMTEQMKKSDPGYAARLEQLEKQVLEYRQSAFKKSGGKRIIPVVFHVIHQYGSENLPKQVLLDAIDQLNDDYQLKNADTSQISAPFKALAADMEIEFRLARKDPHGNCTEGIVRIASPETDRGNDADIKALSRWDPWHYLNIWVVKDIKSNNDQLITAGYAFLPPAMNLSDGIVVDADFVGKGERTLTHEAGHYLGLYHPFQGGCGIYQGNCQTTGDRVCDTPPTAEANFGCNKGQNTCDTDVPDMIDQIENYMDYSNCKVMFTLGQKERVDAILNSWRNQMIAESNLVATGVDTFYPNMVCAPKADFSVDQATICQGATVTFTNLAYNGPVHSYNWSFPGGTPESSNDANPVVTYNEPGYHPVILKVTSSNGEDEKTRENVVRVLSTRSPLKVNQNLDFEQDNLEAAGWLFSSPSTSIRWKRTNRTANSGTYSLYLNNSDDLDHNHSYEFVMPPADLLESHNAQLNFSIAYTRRNNFTADVLRIFVSDNCGQSWTPRKVYTASQMDGDNPFQGGSFIPTKSYWITDGISLESNKNSSHLLVKFVFISGGGNDIYIDDVNFSGEPTGIKSNELAGGYHIYPNPFSGTITIDWSAAVNNPEQLTVIDNFGRVLKNVTLERHSGNLQSFEATDLNIQQPGIYFLRIVSGNQIIIKKISYMKL